MLLNILLIFVCINSVFVRSDDNIIKTTSGSVKGLTIQVLNHTIDQYLGIPYAEPPIGDLRFARTKAIVKPIKDIIDATKRKFSCVQGPSTSIGAMSEDCLTINIWSPKNVTKLKPVMFWIYGGGLRGGSIFEPKYNGSILATHDIVYVSVNHRLGYYGFLYGDEESAPGNLGLYDQLMALKWVNENIYLFGGDKSQITIFGESSGSYSASAHILSPLSQGYFKRVILQSGAQVYNKDRPRVSKEEALIDAKKLAKELNCTDDKQWLQCLRKVDAKHIRLAGDTNAILGTEFLPLSAQKAFAENKFNQGIDIIAGATKDEGAGFGASLLKRHVNKEDFVDYVKGQSKFFHNLNMEKLTEFYLNDTNLNDSDQIKRQMFNFLGDVLIKCPTYIFAKLYSEHSSNQSNVFVYELTYTANVQIVEGMDLGVTHGADVRLVFGLNLLNPHINSTEEKAIKDIQKLWTDFAKNGKPDNNWPKLFETKTHSSVKDLNPESDRRYFHNLYEKTCDGFWSNYF